MLELKFVSSQDKVYTTGFNKAYEINHLSLLKNESGSFQIAYRSDDDNVLQMYMTVETDLDISCYYVGNVPVVHTADAELPNAPKPGLIPDILYPKQTNPKLINVESPFVKFIFEKGEHQNLKAFNDSWQSIWFTVNEKQKLMKSGKHIIKFHFYSRVTGDEFKSVEFCVDIADAKLPAQTLYYTNWFHLDCLSDYYNEPVFTDRFFKIIENYARVAAMNGMNMIYMPSFTPSLDTPIGGERKTVQLVGVELNNGEYTFDFSLMKRYIDVCKKAGIKYFEHSHLFSQWGAKATPKIIARVDGKEKQIFGWKTKASGKKYKEFLHSYIPKLREFLASQGLEKKTLFHISDEPNDEMLDTYKKAISTVGNLLDGCMVGDALSHYTYYEQGLVKTPIVLTNAVKNFYGKCKNFWVYYLSGIGGDYSNRLIINTPEETRIIGIQLYMHDAKGFLQWGYNYYYDSLSQGLFDPKVNPCFYGGRQGTSFCVYPEFDGTALQSIRQKAFFEGINDMRALQLLEKKKGKQFCRDFVKKHFGDVTFVTKVAEPMSLVRFREELNAIVSQKD